MPEINLTISISVILALSAIISPILTAIINNIHHTKIRKMELKQDHLKNTVYHQRNTLENYLKYAGRCIAYSDQDALKEYNEYYFSALLYASPELRPDMMAVHGLMAKFDWDAATPLFEKLIPKIHDLDNYYRELSLLDEYDKTPVTKGELAEYLKQTRYALEGIKNNIISYLGSL